MPDYQASDTTISQELRVIRDSFSEWVEEFPDIISLGESLGSTIHRRGIDVNVYGFQGQFQLGPNEY
jgi:hypothetical protein